jgi:hypothetical protein
MLSHPALFQKPKRNTLATLVDTTDQVRAQCGTWETCTFESAREALAHMPRLIAGSAADVRTVINFLPRWLATALGDSCNLRRTAHLVSPIVFGIHSDRGIIAATGTPR